MLCTIACLLSFIALLCSRCTLSLRYSIVGVTGGEIHVTTGTLTEGQDMILENLIDTVIVVCVMQPAVVLFGECVIV